LKLSEKALFRLYMVYALDFIYSPKDRRYQYYEQPPEGVEIMPESSGFKRMNSVLVKKGLADHRRRSNGLICWPDIKLTELGCKTIEELRPEIRILLVFKIDQEFEWGIGYLEKMLEREFYKLPIAQLAEYLVSDNRLVRKLAIKVYGHIKDVLEANR